MDRKLLCPKCGAENSRFELRCQTCGAPLPKDEEVSKKKRVEVATSWDFWGLWVLLLGGMMFFTGLGGFVGGLIAAALAILILWKLPKRYRGRKIPIHVSIGFLVVGVALFVSSYILL